MDAEYSVEIDRINNDTWHEFLLSFDDASFYQTWSYGEKRWGNKTLSHIVLKKDGRVVSMAQLRILKFPLGLGGVAYLPWGPMWRPKCCKADRKDLENMLNALREEYVVRRRYLLKILPKQMADNDGSFRRLYERAGFVWHQDPQQSVFVDLSPPIETIRKSLRRGWRRSLEAAQKENLEYSEGGTDEMFEEGLKIVQEMKERKQFVEFKDMEEVMLVNKNLRGELKIHIVLCKYQGQSVAVLGWFPFGRVGYPILGGTGNKGLSLKASFPLWWRMIEYYKGIGSEWCDLAGVSIENNPGGYIFKTGLGGGDSSIRDYIGEFEACDNWISQTIFRIFFHLRESYRRARIRFNRHRRVPATTPTD